MRHANQSQQIEDLLIQQFLVIPPGGGAFMLLGGGPLERETDGYAALAGGFVGAPGVPFNVNIYQYPFPGSPVGDRSKASAPDPVGGIEVCNITRAITNKYMAIEVQDTSGVGGLVICNVKLRPISCYDMEVDVVFDPGDVLKTRPVLGSTVVPFNGSSAGASTPMFGATANRLEVIGINLGPRPIDLAFGAAAVFGAGQRVLPNTPFKIDRTSLSIAFIDDGLAGGATVSATQFALP